MNTLLLIPIAACMIGCALTAAVLGRGTRLRASRLGAGLTSAAAFWAVCEILWSSASDPEAVVVLVRLAALGWVSLGPLTLLLFLELSGHPARRSRGLLLPLYVVTAALLLIAVATPWLDVAAVETSWGWSYRVGPAFLPTYLFVGLTFSAGLLVGVRHLRSSPVPAERRHAHLLLGAMALSLGTASFTDGILPALGYHVPRLGVLSITLFGGTVAWGVHRFGYSLLAPGTFDSEILAILPDGVALLNLDGRIRFANPGMEHLAGVGSGSLETCLIEMVIDDVPFDPAEHPSERECFLKSTTKEKVPVALSTALLRDKQDNPIGLVLVARDLREVTNLRGRLVVSDRLAAVGQLAAGVAHEINNPMAFVRANLGGMSQLIDTVATKLPADLETEFEEELREGRELVVESLEGVDRVAAIVNDVKSFSHTGEVGAQRIDLNALLDSVLRMSAPQLPPGCSVERHYDVLPLLRGAPQELKQVFLNLVLNAAQAIGDGDAICIRTRHEGEYVVTTVEDEGCGISPALLEQIFDPFFTTKPVGEGTGLGLSISYQIVRSHGGRITAESEPGRPTRLRVELPVSGEEDN